MDHRSIRMFTLVLKLRQTASASSIFPSSSSFPVLLLLLLLLLQSSQLCSSFDVSRSTVKFLPGFQGPLPFHLETGYVEVGASDEVQLFYYFVKSERNPKEDPLMLWLTGGPGCSAFTAFILEFGPLHFKVEEYNGTVPTLVLNPHSWTKVSSIIFLDLPAYTGFSYTKLPVATQRSDFKQIQHAHQFVRKWLTDHPEFLSNSLYIGGDSYSGMIVPGVASEILKGKEDGIKPSINFQGYLLGNPTTYSAIDDNSKIPYAHGMGLISDELYESLKSSCGGEYRKINPNNEECKTYIAAYEKSYAALLSQYWANDNTVRKALGIRQV